MAIDLIMKVREHLAGFFMKKKKNRRGIVFWIMFFVTVICFLNLVLKLYRVYQSEQDAKKVSKSYSEKIEDSGIIIQEAHSKKKEEEQPQKPLVYGDVPPLDGFTPQFDELQQTNSDCIGWIRFLSPECISYPILWKKGDNAFYLEHNVKGEKDKNGAIYLDGENAPDFTDQNNLIYGHNMWNDAMFSRLSDYRKKEQWEKSPYFFIYKPDGTELVCRIYAASEIDYNDKVYQQMIFADRKEYESHLEEWAARSLYQTDTVLDSDRHSITLSTCLRMLNSDRRFTIQALVVGERHYK